jgi:uncharacterized lipoprotein YmbA
MNRLATIATLGALASFWAGCASPPSKFYTLSPVATPGAAAASYSVAVGPVSVPPAVDRSQIVVRLGPNQVAIDEFNLWASPLPDDIARVVAQNLVSLLGTPLGTVFAQSGSAGASYRVGIDVLLFESAPGEAATLDAVWTVRSTKGGQSRSGRTTVSEPVPNRSYAALAAAHSRALGRLSGEVADAIRALESGWP